MKTIFVKREKKNYVENSSPLIKTRKETRKSTKIIKPIKFEEELCRKFCAIYPIVYEYKCLFNVCTWDGYELTF